MSDYTGEGWVEIFGWGQVVEACGDDRNETVNCISLGTFGCVVQEKVGSIM